MALGFSENSGGGSAINPIIKYDTRSGEFLRVDRSQGSDGVWIKSESELPYPVRLAVDFANIRVGWIGFVSGAPDFHMAPLDQPMPPRPDVKDAAGKPIHNQGFQVMVASKDLGLREFTSGAKTVTVPMDQLHSAYESQKADHEGKVPVVTISGAERYSVDTPQGQLTFKKPVWSITEWIDRPALFDGGGQPSPAATETAPAMVTPTASITPSEAATGADLF